MDDLISKQDAVNELREYITEPNISDDESEIIGYNDGIELAISVLSTIRRKAVWYHNEDEGILTCSWCISEFDDDIMKYWNNIPNFCPNCGSEMQWCDCADEVEAHDNVANSQLMKLSKRYPSAQQWIPCSERLPNYDEEVLVDYHGKVRLASLTKNDEEYPWYFIVNRFNAKLETVRAWMPLPDCYQGDEK